MKVQTGNVLIQDLGLRKGELVQIGDGPDFFVMKYAGVEHKNGKTYDILKPVRGINDLGRCRTNIGRRSD